MLFLWFAISAESGVAGIELNPSDPQGINSQLVNQCLSYTGKCNVWYTSGTYRVTHTIYFPGGVTNVYLTGVTLIPCGKMNSMFETGKTIPPGAFMPQFHGLTIDDSKPCGDFVPPLKTKVDYP